jgi:RNA polymerase sigma factor (sigma-70 family)
MCVMAGDASPANDDEVRRLIAQGAYRPALEVLVRGYQHLIVRYYVTLLGDVAQEVFLGAYAALPRFRQEASLRTRLLAIARKQCLQALRDARRRRRVEEAQRQAMVSGAHRTPPDPSEEDPAVRWGLARRGMAERTVLLLRYETGLPLGEMGHILGRSDDVYSDQEPCRSLHGAALDRVSLGARRGAADLGAPTPRTAYRGYAQTRGVA